MPPRCAALAVPGDIATKTGGYLYDARLMAALSGAGWNMRLIRLPDGFPHPDAAERAEAQAALAGLPPDCPVIVDGLAYGAMDTGRLRAVAAPLVALVHHPLALETGLAPEVATALVERERDNLVLARHILVPSPHTARVLKADYGVPGDKLTVVEPGVVRPALTAATKAEPPLILSVGIQAARKGHDVFLRSLAHLSDLEWQAVIVGRVHDAAVAHALAELRDALGLTDRVRLAGLVGDVELQDLYRAAWVFALATRYEGYGMVFAEALVHGLPIVTCRVGAVPDTVPEGAGILVEAEDACGFADALRRVLSDTDTRLSMASASSQAGQKLPDWAMQAQRVGGVLKGLLSGESGSP